MYGGHGRSIDCWKMDNDETILLSASNVKEKSTRNAAGGGSFGVLVALMLLGRPQTALR